MRKHISKDLMTKLKEMNIEVSNHMTMLDDEVVNKLDNEYQAENLLLQMSLK